MDTPELERFAADLRETSANLEAHIQQRAEAIAAPRIAEAEAEIARLRAEHERDAVGDKQRFMDLQREAQRQIAALERQAGQGAWLAGYLPKELRRAAGITRCNRSVLQQDWIDHVAHYAAEHGLSLDTERQHQQREGATQ